MLAPDETHAAYDAPNTHVRPQRMTRRMTHDDIAPSAPRWIATAGWRTSWTSVSQVRNPCEADRHVVASIHEQDAGRSFRGGAGCSTQHDNRVMPLGH